MTFSSILRATRGCLRGGFSRSCSLLRHNHTNAGRHNRRVVWNVVLVPQEQLQCVRSRLQGNLRLGLASAKVEVVEVVGNGLIERWQLGVD